jgi:hypothetical protein
MDKKEPKQQKVKIEVYLKTANKLKGRMKVGDTYADLIENLLKE